MEKELEDYLWNEIGCSKNTQFIPLRTPRDVINEMISKGLIKSPKQAWRTLEKWLSKGKYNYGTSLDMGWRELD